jgi:hypothetical protein
MESIFCAPVPAHELLELANRLDTNDQPVLVTAASLGASYLVRGSPQLALQIHEQLIPYLRQTLSTSTGMYRQAVIPFVAAFWKARLTERRIHFRNPNEIQNCLHLALA